MRSKAWQADLLTVLRRFEREQIEATSVAACFARLNAQVHAKCKTVGPRCVVAWEGTGRLKAKAKDDHWVFDGTTVMNNPPVIPRLVQGFDMGSYIRDALPPIEDVAAAFELQRMHPGSDASSLFEEMFRRIVETPLKDTPDERLR
jgi:hypothetical protein